jgi:ribosome biogenesis GTPase
MTLRGLIIRSQSGFYTVETDAGLLTCQLRGRMKRGPRVGDVLAVGDWVKISEQGSGKGMIEDIEPRQRMLSRLDPTPRGVYQQIIFANPDQLVLTFACANPEPHLGMLDRFLVIAEKQEIPNIIVANKVDLVGQEKASQLFGHYQAIGYEVLYTAARAGIGVEALRQRLAGKLSVFVGPSGVGKSSLLNAMQDGLGLAIREVSLVTNKGKHTTVVRQMFPLKGGGYVADTPGLKALALWDIEPEELDGYFPEIRDRVAECSFNDCTHLHEPDCAIRIAVDKGEIHPARYQSYLRMRAGQEDDGF